MEKFLPIGSVVSLKGAKTRIMIIGYKPIPKLQTEKSEYDYSACIFPCGVFDSDKMLAFNHEQIEFVYYYGLKDEESELFVKTLKEVTDKEKEIEMPILNKETEDSI